MSVIAKLNYLRIAPRKVRLVADLIRKDKVEHAERILNFTVKKAAKPIAKLLKTAIADARNNFHLNTNNLYISKIIVNEGPKYKRWRPRSRGMANQIEKRTSHITLILDEIKPTKRIKKTGRKKGTEKKILSAKNVETKESPTESGIKVRQPKLRPEIELSKPKPKIERGIKRIFRRKAF